MAALAGLRESRSRVIRDRSPQRCGALPSGDMATVTGCGTQRVVVIHMARRAGSRRRGNVHPRQGESRGAMVESCRVPAHRRMAYSTVPYRKLRTRRRVHRIIRLLPGRQMAARVPATVQGSRQVVIVVDVAGSAGHAGMPIREREACHAVIEGRPCPTIHCMARRALRHREKRWVRGMRGIRRLLPGRQMAARIPAIVQTDARQVVIVIDVARRAGRLCV